MQQSALSPLVMLATSMHAQPGVYAVLLGSGVSTGAGLPTGWGVVSELVRRAAAAAHPNDPDSIQLAENHPEEWWAQHGDGELGYAALLARLAPVASTRQGLLADFFEPTEEERQQGVKMPSKAHHAVAQLVKQGRVRVILTTNFDRLMEQALEAAGVAPQVITRPEAVNGMAPLAHARATVIKLHGDYKDLGTRNTPEELSEYPHEWTTLLRQIFDEYGLIVSGWSADWDTALVNALSATSSRRYPLYWDSRSSRGDAAQRLIASRGGLVLQAGGADELFAALLDSVQALDRLSEAPLTTAMAIARLKRYLPDPLRRIDLHDLLMDTAVAVADRIAEQPVSVPSLDGAFIQDLWHEHLESTAPLVHMLVTGVWHDSDGVHDGLWREVLQRLVDAGTAPLSSAITGLDNARLWPALVAMTATGVAAVQRGHDRLLIHLADRVQGRGRMGSTAPMPAAQLLHPNRLLDGDWVNGMPRWNTSRWLYPSSHLLKSDMRRFFEVLIPLDSQYTDAFHGYEYRLGLIQERQNAGGASMSYRALSGEYVGENAWTWGEEQAPYAELAFLQASDQSRDTHWMEFLGVDDLGQTLITHREVLKRYRRFG